MTGFQIFLDIMLALLAIYVIVDIIHHLATVQGTWLEKIWAGFRESLTILWSRFVLLVAALADLLVYVADWINAPGMADAIKAVVRPEYIGPLIVFIVFVTELARRRTLTKPE